MQYAPASIHPTQHIFQPPHKALVFNKSLITNDGVLITYIANTSQLDYDEAEALVRKYVNNIENSLRQKGDFVIHGVGKFYKDVEDHIRFKAEDSINFLLTAYGLDHFISPAIIRRESFEPQIAVQSIAKKKKRFNWFGIILSTLVIGLIIAQILDINNIIPLRDKSYAGYTLSDKKVSNSTLKNITSDSVSKSSSHNDTVVNIIVIRDETNQLKPEINSNDNSLKDSQTDNNNNYEYDTAPSNYTVTNRIYNQKNIDSLSYTSKNITPQKGEYNPKILGDYCIVFFTTSDSLKSIAYQEKLWSDRVSVRIISSKNSKVLTIAKAGYLTSGAAAKDLAIYKLLGYENIYIKSLK